MTTAWSTAALPATGDAGLAPVLWEERLEFLISVSLQARQRALENG
jgi:hypothetical protein